MELVVASKSDLKEIVDSSVEAATAKALAQISSTSSASPKEWLTNKEAKEFLGLSKTTLQRLRASGALVYSKVGANIFYKYKDVVELLERHVEDL